MTARPTTLTLAALGGQGGGVVTGWLVDVAEREGYWVQATSVPGVAQRTGATTYYLEFFPEKEGEQPPIMALMPAPGRSDVVVASELAEAVRMVQRGIVASDHTTLITSTHRVYTISEKSHLDDGRADADELLDAVRGRAKRIVTLDMEQLAAQHDSVASAAILGAIAGADVLPFSLDNYRAAIRAGGKGVDASLLTFEAARQAATAGPADSNSVADKPPSAALPAALLARLDEFPTASRSTLVHGVERLLDYQGEAYAIEYLSKLQRISKTDSDGRLTAAVAKGLALWMSFEDTFRVAQLKIRPERIVRLQQEAQLKPGELMNVSEFLKPRVEEICGSMPVRLGRMVLGSPLLSRLLAAFSGGRRVKVTSISGFLMMRIVAGLRRTRPWSLRYAEEHSSIERWLHTLEICAASNYELACELADCQQLVAGYGETHARGRQHFDALLNAAEGWVDQTDGAHQLRVMRGLALQDDDRGGFPVPKVA